MQKTPKRDFVKVVLYKDETPLEIPEELLVCLADEPTAYEKFQKLTEGEQKSTIDWIYSAKTDQTKAKRIIAIMDELVSGRNSFGNYTREIRLRDE